VKYVGKPDAGNPHVRFDERGRETGDWPSLKHRAIPRLYRIPLAVLLTIKLLRGSKLKGNSPVTPKLHLAGESEMQQLSGKSGVDVDWWRRGRAILNQGVDE